MLSLGRYGRGKTAVAWGVRVGRGASKQRHGSEEVPVQGLVDEVILAGRLCSPIFWRCERAAKVVNDFGCCSGVDSPPSKPQLGGGGRC